MLKCNVAMYFKNFKHIYFQMYLFPNVIKAQISIKGIYLHKLKIKGIHFYQRYTFT